MNIRDWIYNKIYGKKDAIIAQLRDEIATIKKVKQEQIDKTNAYWKTQLYNKNQKRVYPQAGNPR